MLFIFQIKAYLINKYGKIIKRIKEEFRVEAKNLNNAFEEIRKRIEIYEKYYQQRFYKAEIKLKKVIFTFRDME